MAADSLECGGDPLDHGGHEERRLQLWFNVEKKAFSWLELLRNGKNYLEGVKPFSLGLHWDAGGLTLGAWGMDCMTF